MNFLRFLQNLKLYGLEYFKKYYGCYRGLVGSNKDPEGLGRIQLKIPGIYGNVIYKYWAWPKGIYAGSGKGSFFIPEVNDGVWVSFENGDPRYPVWEYGWWAKSQIPEGASLTNKVFQTESGNKIEYDDENKLIRITSGSGKVLEIGDTISLGSSKKSLESAVLGNTLKTKIDSLSDLINTISEESSKIIVNTALGPSSVPTNSAVFKQVSSDISDLKKTLSEILSTKVTLD